ncbi:hypothetical protein [Synechococcus sp. W55.1]|uniref:hypothetical protein n=1 Tax=Synechococcus sp. W55.1 TaxID=2964512 RepID=UPI0039C2D916
MVNLIKGSLSIVPFFRLGIAQDNPDSPPQSQPENVLLGGETGHRSSPLSVTTPAGAFFYNF